MVLHIRKWWTAYIASVMLAAIIVLFALLIPALQHISMQAHAGAQARQRQCKTLPIATKVYADAEHRGVISPSELVAFKATSLPPGCKH